MVGRPLKSAVSAQKAFQGCVNNTNELFEGKGCDLCLTEKVVILLGHDGPEKIPRSTILLNRRTELLQKCRHKRKFTYAGMTSRQNKWNYEYPGNPTGTED